MSVQVGQQVNYVPHEHHALVKDAQGDYPWKMARRVHPRYMDGNKVVREEVLQHLDSSKEVDDYLTFISRHPNSGGERGNLVFLYPVKTWKATVTAVHDDDTVTADIPLSSGVTLHYKLPVTTPTHKDHKSAHTYH